MLDPTDEILRKLAFQRGALALLGKSEWEKAVVREAIQQLDRVIESLTSPAP